MKIDVTKMTYAPTIVALSMKLTEAFGIQDFSIEGSVDRQFLKLWG